MILTRRAVLAAAPPPLLPRFFPAPSIGHAAAPFGQPALPFKEDALAPHISAKTVGMLHYGKHHKAYFDKLQRLKGTPCADMKLEEIVTASLQQTANKRSSITPRKRGTIFWDQFVPGGRTGQRKNGR